MFELRVYDLVLGKKEQWEHRIIQGLPDRCKLSEPVGVWFTEFGPVNTGMIILILLFLFSLHLAQTFLKGYYILHTKQLTT